MNRARVLQGVRQLRFEALLDRHERGDLSQLEAAQMLGVSERTFRRWRDRLRDEGPVGLVDRRIGKPSSRRASPVEIARMLGLYQERYSDFTVKHFHEQLVKRHNYKLGYSVTRVNLQAAGLARPAPRRSEHRRKRPRCALPGEMLHQDASRFAWLSGEAREYDLVVTLDDATSAIYSAFLVEEEGTASSFRGLGEVLERHGLFCELYTDRGSHYFHTPEAGEAFAALAAVEALDPEILRGHADALEWLIGTFGALSDNPSDATLGRSIAAELRAAADRLPGLPPARKSAEPRS